MTIISISLNDKILEEIDRLQKESGFSGRSEVIRAGVRKLVQENKKYDSLKGKIKAVLLIVHDEDAEQAMSQIKHKFEDILDTQIHTNLKGEKCLEIFVINGDSERVKDLVKTTEAQKKIDYSKFIIP